MPQVLFEYITGLKTKIVNSARLAGSWDEHGKPSKHWAIIPMESFTADDGCPAFRAAVDLDASGVGREFRFYHHLIGDGHHGPEFAKLLSVAGTGTDEPLAMGYFTGAAAWSGHSKVVYHKSHDEAGNAAHSQRTIRTAVNGAPLVGLTRRYAEARCRFVAGMSILSAATPMFLMGEEVGAQKDYTYDNFLRNREDLLGERRGDGANLFAFAIPSRPSCRLTVSSFCRDCSGSGNGTCRPPHCKRFVDRQAVSIGGERLDSRYVLLAAGARPVGLDIEGAEHLATSDRFLELDILPRRLVFIGGGYIAAELSHIAARAGAAVTILQRGERLLKAFDRCML
jgi:hypothetical protein